MRLLCRFSLDRIGAGGAPVGSAAVAGHLDRVAPPGWGENWTILRGRDPRFQLGPFLVRQDIRIHIVGAESLFRKRWHDGWNRLRCKSLLAREVRLWNWLLLDRP